MLYARAACGGAGRVGAAGVWGARNVLVGGKKRVGCEKCVGWVRAACCVRGDSAPGVSVPLYGDSCAFSVHQVFYTQA